jgi:hypothetical protein
MIAVRRLTGAQSAALNPTIPLAVWCRPAALLILRGRECPGAGSAPARSRPPGSRLTDHIRLMCRAIMMRSCLLAARLAILAARLLLLMGLLTSENAASVLRWSSRLIATGMLLWRQGRAHARP